MIDLASAIADFVATYPSHRVPLDDLRGYATRADPSLLDDPSARDRLDATLRYVASQGGLVLPRGTSHWDTRATPALPAWVAKPARVRVSPAPAPARVWPQALEPAAALATRPDEYALLERIARWMRDHPGPMRIPLEERSLQVLGDEKALALELGKRLFLSGALTLDLLACYPTPLPFASQYIAGTGHTTLLVSENNASYHSLVTAARALPARVRPDIHIAWGAGAQFPVSVASTSLLDPAPTAIFYIGDLDAAGLRIPSSASRAAEALGLPPVRPAEHLYAWLVENGTPTHDRSNIGAAPEFTAPTNWLPERLRQPVLNLLSRGVRIPQETLTLAHLRTHPELLDLFIRTA